MGDKRNITCITLSISEPREKKKKYYNIRIKISPLLLIKFRLGDRASYEIEMHHLRPKVDNHAPPATTGLAHAGAQPLRRNKRECAVCRLTGLLRGKRDSAKPSQAHSTLLKFTTYISLLPRTQGQNEWEDEMEECDAIIKFHWKKYQQSWRIFPPGSCYRWKDRTAFSENVVQEDWFKMAE